MDEVNVQTVDLGHELREGVQPRLDLAPVMRPPVFGDLLDRIEPHALRIVGDRLTIRPAGCGNAPVQILQLLVGGENLNGLISALVAEAAVRAWEYSSAPAAAAVKDVRRVISGRIWDVASSCVLGGVDGRKLTLNAASELLYHGIADTFVCSSLLA